VLVAQGNRPEALKSFRDGLAIRDRLAQADLGNAGWQRDLSVSNERLGDVCLAHQQQSSSIARALLGWFPFVTLIRLTWTCSVSPP